MKTFVVTGATTGIGGAIRERLEAQGDKVINVDLRDCDIESDLSSKAGRAAALAEIERSSPEGIDGFIPCAGLGPQFDPIEQIVSLNYFAVRDMTEALQPLLAKKSGATVLIASNSASIPGLNTELLNLMSANDEAGARDLVVQLDGFQAYAGSKCALLQWMRGVSAAWAEKGLRINAVAPGSTMTPLLEEGLKDPVWGDAIRGFTVPLGGFAQPHQIASGVLFFAR